MSILGKLNEASSKDWDNLTKPFAPLCPTPDYTAPVPREQVKSDGDSTSYYEIPCMANELQDLIEYRKMDFATANVFKAAWRDGKKAGTSSLYDWKKIRWFADRKIAELEKFEQEERKYEEDNGIY